MKMHIEFDFLNDFGINFSFLIFKLVGDEDEGVGHYSEDEEESPTHTHGIDSQV